jgi:hypothetical protein
MNKKQQSCITTRRPAGTRRRHLEELERRPEIVEMKGITHCFGRFLAQWARIAAAPATAARAANRPPSCHCGC